MEPNRAPTIFLSYASADREAARAIKDALPGFGLEVWYDESDLGGGEIWDQKIRKQIRECDYFMPLISAQTEARHEGYFRREWRLAVERTLDMADDHAFLLPVVIDDTNQNGARVPEKFLSIQWVRVPGGQPNPALQSLCKRLVSGEPVDAPHAPAPTVRVAALPSVSARPPVTYPPFPTADPEAKAQYWLHVVAWACKSAWIFFSQLPRWVRILIYMWLAVVVMAKSCSSSDYRSSRISRSEPEQLPAIPEKYHGSFDKKNISQLAAQIAHLASDDASEMSAQGSRLLAIPFTAPAGNAEAAQIASSTFAAVYGKLFIAHRGQVGLSPDSIACDDSKAARERARSKHSTYVLCGAVGTEAAVQVLSIRISKVSDGSVVWSKSYPVAGADSAAIAAEVNSHVPTLDEDS